MTASEACPECDGRGKKTYSSTALWRDDVIGGQAFTEGPCDQCWGSGDARRPWPSHKRMEALERRVAELEADAARYRYIRENQVWYRFEDFAVVGARFDRGDDFQAKIMLDYHIDQRLRS